MAEQSSVAAATDRKLEQLDELVPGIAQHPLAATARVLAREIDGKNSLTSKAMATQRMVDIFERFEAQVPAKEPDDVVAQLADR